MKQNIDDLGVVGIIVDDWDIAKSFKPKTITTDYSTWTTYISRRAVPANTPITDLYYWKPISRLDKQLAFDYNEFKDTMVRNFYNLRQLVYSFLNSTEHGTALASELGDGDFIAVSQHYLTDVINGIYNKLENITGETLCGFNMIVTPDYFFGDRGCNVHVTANTVGLTGTFEEIKFYVNGELIREETESTNYVKFDTEIEDTAVVRCEAKILGVEYSDQKIISRYAELWLFAATDEELGADYANIADFMTVANRVSTDNGMRSENDRQFNAGQHVVIVMEEGMRSAFYRADINGLEIPMTEAVVTLNEVNYKVLVSEDTYQSGIYNIDING